MTDRRRVLVAGSANIDLVTRVARCPKPGESLVGQQFTTVPGGKGANQAVAAARLQAATTFVGCVGRDAFGDILRRSLESAGVDIAHIKTHATEPTGTACIFVLENGDNAIVVTPAANHGLLPEDIERLRPVIAEHDVLLTQLEIPLDTVKALLRIGRELGVFSILDAGPVRDVPLELLTLADLVSPNETEAEALTGLPIESDSDAGRAAAYFHEAGVGRVVLKLGERGSMFSGGGQLLHMPAFTISAVDTVAAGDAFTAALAIAWDTMPLTDTLRFANAAGALAASKPGAQDAMPARAAVEQLLAERT